MSFLITTRSSEGSNTCHNIIGIGCEYDKRKMNTGDNILIHHESHHPSAGLGLNYLCLATDINLISCNNWFEEQPASYCVHMSISKNPETGHRHHREKGAHAYPSSELKHWAD